MEEGEGRTTKCLLCYHRPWRKEDFSRADRPTPPSILRISFPKRPSSRQPTGRKARSFCRRGKLQRSVSSEEKWENGGDLAPGFNVRSRRRRYGFRLFARCRVLPRPRVRLTLGALMTCYYGACGRPRLDTPAPAAAERPNLSCRTIGTTRAIFPRQNAFRILQRH